MFPYWLDHMQELRKQLEAQVLTIDTLRNENRTSAEHHENVQPPVIFDLSFLLLISFCSSILELLFIFQ